MTTETDDYLGGFVVRVYETADPDCPPGLRFVAHCSAPNAKGNMAPMPAIHWGPTEADARAGLTDFLAEGIRKERKREDYKAGFGERMAARRQARQ